ncbi:hypothetical protein HCN44_004668 [Aphidius gifuensis]|uniref:Receptor expression-enhancing protein n=1 Tax=Aphidius gifuensis TaxID=684658 RepID=A0A834XZM5_APHGI|nr:receptor expression-enhancing protein 4-like isoform X2 [Aphidius gifuensis]KAF7995196.1 hypothetical protein HCN44_004668 [Aphidius gifuensis]
MISSIVSRIVILVFGTLYPAYASYKAVRTKNVKEYVKWMMYWIVFALFTCAETFTDVFFSFWFPFYYEIKIILVLWLLSPATKGSSILYRRFVHPALIRREAEIDDALARATEQGYTAVLHLGTKGVNYATTVLMQTAIKGGGGLVQQLKKSYSLSDLTGEKDDENRNTKNNDEPDMTVEPRRRVNPGRRGYSPRRTQSSSNRVDMYFSEVDVEVRQPTSREPISNLANIKSSDDISSGYSSGEAMQVQRMTPSSESLMRTSSVGARTRSSKPRTITKKSPEEKEDDDDEDEWLNFTAEPRRSPTSLSHISAQQALELFLLISSINNTPTKSCDDLNNTESSSVCSLLNTQDETVENNEKSSNLIDSINDKIIDESSIDYSSNNSDKKIIDICKITEEICHDKMNELKRLLTTAHNTVVLNSQDKIDNKITNDIWTTPSTSTRSLEINKRAGKYHKKQAPKIPILSTINFHNDNNIVNNNINNTDNKLCNSSTKQETNKEENSMRQDMC